MIRLTGPATHALGRLNLSDRPERAVVQELLAVVREPECGE